MLRTKVKLFPPDIGVILIVCSHCLVKVPYPLNEEAIILGRFEFASSSTNLKKYIELAVALGNSISIVVLSRSLLYAKYAKYLLSPVPLYLYVYL